MAFCFVTTFNGIIHNIEGIGLVCVNLMHGRHEIVVHHIYFRTAHPE